MKSASEIQKFTTDEIKQELKDVCNKRRKLEREIDHIDTYLVGLREEARKRHLAEILNITSGGDSDDVSF